MARLTLLVLFACAGLAAAAPAPPILRAHAVQRDGAITIDGHLDEAAWAAAPKQHGFVQRFPKDGVAATFDTSFAILYDDDAIYVGVWAHDPEPAKIRRLLTRRDVESPSDEIDVGLDSYHDRRTAFIFQVNAADVQRDMLVFDDATIDDTWDAVWTSGTAITPDGWTAELRIPLSQLRFSARPDEVWGVQVRRVVGRTQEESTWSPWPRSGPQIVSKFGVLDGLGRVHPARRLELLPYVLGGVGFEPVDAGDPLNAHVVVQKNAGIDVKYGLGPAFTLSATINPDFGQVEADPSQINLSANELFFAEKRPFFLEGSDLFHLPIGQSDGTNEGAFYSRRIGAAPDTSNLDYQYLRAPPATTIYGAAKLTGKQDGWSVGVLDAVTGKESAALIDASGARQDPVVAPLTNYAVARIKRDLNEGKTSIGVSATAVDRALAGTGLEDTMHDQAYTAGAQILHRWADNAWTLDLHTVASVVHGTPAAIEQTQEDTIHLYQRPDATNEVLDPTRRALSGLGATWQVGRLGDTKHWRYGFGGDLRTPGLELNDVGFQTGTTNRMLPYIWAQYHQDEPSAHVLNWQVNADVFEISTFEPLVESYGFECDASVQLPNQWQLGGHCMISNNLWDVQALRGGEALHGDPNMFLLGWLSSDPRKRVAVSITGHGTRTPASDETDFELDTAVTIQARSNVDVSLGPSWYARIDPLQYVDQPVDTVGTTHYIFGTIHETTASLTLRANWTFSPHVSLQIYAQPYIAAGRYTELKDVNNPHAPRFEDRFHVLSGNELATRDDEVYVNYGGSYAFDRPDFDLRALRSTVVLRWEYHPGSNVYAIWSHGGSDQLDDGRFQLARDVHGLLAAAAEDIVMIKANYWIGL